MLKILIIASLAAGTLVACYADRLPIPQARAELLGGALLVFGFALIGFGLSPLMR